jgi:hypothetical protein
MKIREVLECACPLALYTKSDKTNENELTQEGALPGFYSFASGGA